MVLDLLKILAYTSWHETVCRKAWGVLQACLHIASGSGLYLQPLSYYYQARGDKRYRKENPVAALRTVLPLNVVQEQSVHFHLCSHVN